MKIDILKVVDEVDHYIFRRMDMTEAELKITSVMSTIALLASSVYMIAATAKFRKLNREIEVLKNAKGE
jgi:hypothetical protein